MLSESLLYTVQALRCRGATFDRYRGIAVRQLIRLRACEKLLGSLTFLSALLHLLDVRLSAQRPTTVGCRRYSLAIAAVQELAVRRPGFASSNRLFSGVHAQRPTSPLQSPRNKRATRHSADRAQAQRGKRLVRLVRGPPRIVMTRTAGPPFVHSTCIVSADFQRSSLTPQVSPMSENLRTPEAHRHEDDDGRTCPPATSPPIQNRTLGPLLVESEARHTFLSPPTEPKVLIPPLVDRLCCFIADASFQRQPCSFSRRTSRA